MPRKFDLPKLHVFISYASEDAVLAQAINAELKTAFSQAIIKTTLDSELKLGVEWRSRLEEALGDADVLLIVATGRQKFSHSYTGYEVGYFSALKRTREKMKHFNSERLIIPIGVLEKIPEALSDIESLNLTAALTPFLVEADTLKNKERFRDSIESDSATNPFLKLFKRLKEVVQTLHTFDDDLTQDFQKRANESATRLYGVFFDEFQKRVSFEKYAERKIIVRLPTTARIEPLADLPAATTLEFIGGTFEVFKINPPADKTITWGTFVQQIPHDDTTTAWTDIIRSLIVSAKSDDFADNRRLLASSDRRRFFRLFVGRSVVYYSGILELHIYVVEVKSRDYGDPITTMLLKAISVGLMYRTLFLEGKSSEFSPVTIRATMARDLPKAVSEMLQELDYILWVSTDAGLSQPRNINLILGDLAKGEIERRIGDWEKLKSELTSNALQVLRATSDADLMQAKGSFEDHLTSFCSSTVQLNKDFLGSVLHLLEGIVLKTDKSLQEIPTRSPAEVKPRRPSDTRRTLTPKALRPTISQTSGSRIVSGVERPVKR